MPEPDFKITIIFLINGRGAELFYTLIVDLITKWSLFLLNQQGNNHISEFVISAVFRIWFGINDLNGISGWLFCLVVHY